MRIEEAVEKCRPNIIDDVCLVNNNKNSIKIAWIYIILQSVGHEYLGQCSGTGDVSKFSLQTSYFTKF